MTQNILLDTALDQALSRVKAENKNMFPDLFNPHRTAVFFESEELVSEIELGIEKMRRNINEFRKVYELMRKEYPEFMDKTWEKKNAVE